jgi:hypothetical protein
MVAVLIEQRRRLRQNLLARPLAFAHVVLTEGTDRSLRNLQPVGQDVKAARQRSSAEASRRQHAKVRTFISDLGFLGASTAWRYREGCLKGARSVHVFGAIELQLVVELLVRGELPRGALLRGLPSAVGGRRLACKL